MHSPTRPVSTLATSVDGAVHSRPVHFRIGAFELDPTSGELTHEGNTTLLQSQPLQLLLMLIEHGGEMVTRAEIQKRMWDNDVIVDFDHSINTLVRKLRRALGDSAEAPIYIETFSRRGYRLKVPVELVENRLEGSTGTNSSIFPSITRRAVWKTLHRSDSASSVQHLGFRSQTSPIEQGKQSAVAVRSEEKIKL